MKSFYILIHLNTKKIVCTDKILISNYQVIVEFYFTGNNLTSILSKCRQTRPRITKWSPILMETIGNEATLPCSAKGNPSPQIYWIDKDEKLVSNDPDSRYKVTYLALSR